MIRYSFLGFFIGILFASFVNSLFFIFGFLSLSLIFLVSYFFKKENKDIYLFIFLFFVFTTLGLLRFFIFENNIKTDISKYEDKKVYLSGTVFKQSESDGQKQKVFLEVYEIQGLKTVEKIKNRILVFLPLYPKIEIGQRIKISGEVSLPEVIESEGRVFNYPAFLKKDKIVAIVYFGSLVDVQKNKDFFISSFFYPMKSFFEKSLSNLLKEPELSLASGIIFGSDNMSSKIEDSFRKSGLSHIVVLSGYNITVLAEGILKILIPYTRFATSISIFSIFIFIFTAGLSSTAIRASFMSSLSIFARRSGRTYEAGRALFFTAFLISLINPFIFLYDPSFHLSFLATFAIIFVNPLINKKIPIKDSFLKEILSTTISAQILVTPYILMMTSKVSIYSLLSNILVLPFVPISMFLGFLSSVFGFIKPIGFIFAFPLHLLLKYFIYISSLVSNLPYSQVYINFNYSRMFLTYIAIILLYLKYKD